MTTLRRIGFAAFAVLALCVGASFGDAYASGVKVRVLQRADTNAVGQSVDYPEVDSAEVSAIEVEIPPGGETGWHTHPFPGYAYLLAGELTLELEDGRALHFKAGDTVLESVGLRHNGRNTGKGPVKLVAFFTGAKGRSFSEKTPPPSR
jgi:quercetin dioxygenase-like cupin family protein